MCKVTLIMSSLQGNNCPSLASGTLQTPNPHPHFLEASQKAPAEENQGIRKGTDRCPALALGNLRKHDSNVEDMFDAM